MSQTTQSQNGDPLLGYITRRTRRMKNERLKKLHLTAAAAVSWRSRSLSVSGSTNQQGFCLVVSI